MNLPRAEHGLFVVRRKFVHTENRNNVLQLLVALQYGLHAAGHTVVFFAHDLRRQRQRGGGQRIHRGVNAQLGDGTLQHDGGIQVRKGGGRGGVGQIVRRHVYRLEGGDGTLGGGGNSLLQIAHFRSQCGLITHRRRRTAEQRAHLGTGLGKTEDVVHEEQHVLTLFIPEIFGHRQCRQRHAHTGSGRLVHLTVHQPDSRPFGEYRQALVVVLGVTVFVLLGLDHISLDHLIVEIVAFTSPLTHAREHRDPAVQFRDVVDQLHDHHSLAHARATKRAHFAALQEGQMRSITLMPVLST